MENFDAMAKGYDTEKRINRAKIIADKIRSHIPAGDKKSAIEYGCGTGLVGLQLANDFKTLQLIDSSPEMIKLVEEKLSNLNNPAVTALCGDLMDDASGTLHADYIFSSLVQHHIMDTENALRRFHNILNDGGRLLIVDIDEDDGKR